MTSSLGDKWQNTDEETDVEVCGYETNHPEYGSIRCVRAPSARSTSCFWHSEIDGKTSEEVDSRLNEDALLAGAYLEEAEISSLNIRSADFFDASFIGALIDDLDAMFIKFRNCTFRDVTIESSHFRETNFEHTYWKDSEITGSDFTGTCFQNTSWQGVSAVDCEFNRSNWECSKVNNSTFTNCRLNGAKFEDVTWEDVDMKSCHLRSLKASESLFWKCTFEGPLHASNFKNSNLRRSNISTRDGTSVKFPEAKLEQVTAERCELHHAVFDEDSILDSADLSHADLESAYMAEISAESADFTGANLENANLRGSNLKKSNLSQANLFDADLRKANIYGTITDNARINPSTSFSDDYLISLTDCISDSREGYLSVIPGFANSTYNNISELDDLDFDKAAWIHQRLEELFSKNQLRDLSQKHYQKRKTIRTIQSSLNGRYGNRSWWLLWLSKHSSKHGESPLRILSISGLVMILYAGLYSISDVLTGPDGEIEYRIGNLLDLSGYSLADVVTGFGENIYFSIVTFTTLGYVQPKSAISKMLTGSEALIGTILMAALIFVWGRKTTQ